MMRTLSSRDAFGIVLTTVRELIGPAWSQYREALLGLIYQLDDYQTARTTIKRLLGNNIAAIIMHNDLQSWTFSKDRASHNANLPVIGPPGALNGDVISKYLVLQRDLGLGDIDSLMESNPIANRRELRELLEEDQCKEVRSAAEDGGISRLLQGLGIKAGDEAVESLMHELRNLGIG